MTSTQILTCSLCELRFTNRPHLELHIREDHVRSADHEPAVHSPASGPHPGGAEHRPGQPPTEPRTGQPRTGQPRTGKDVIARAGMPHRRPRARPAMTALRRVLGVLRHITAELLLAWEAIIRQPPASRPRPPADGPADPDTHAAANRGRRNYAA